MYWVRKVEREVGEERGWIPSFPFSDTFTREKETDEDSLVLIRPQSFSSF